MASATYPLHAIVLRKTKLGESDLIITCLAQDGRLVKAVAKGARKPSSAFSSRLEIFCEVDMLLVQGKNLDIVKEARLIDAHVAARLDMEHAAACAPVVDLASRLAQPDLAQPKLFALIQSFLQHAQESTAEEVVALCAACLLKAFAFAGFRPSFNACVGCGAAMDLSAVPARSMLSFCAAEGGVVCDRCLLFSDVVQVAAEVLQWAQFLLMSTFDDVARAKMPLRVSFEVLHVCQTWSRYHVDARLKSLDFLFTCGLF